PGKSFVYFVYSYNSGTSTSPATRFKIVRLTWNASTNSVTSANDLVVMMPTGYDHLGGRLLAVKQNGNNYLYFTAGDNGISETNSPNCYNPQSLNPNNYVQDTTCQNGKIHRFNIDGSIPADNPVAGKSLYTRGHRNPQGLMFNPAYEIIYSIEHGDRTDDEINVLRSGKNYGWKNIRGYHADNNYPGEAASIASFTPNPGIVGDSLMEPIYAWCATPQPTVSNNADWCTVAPSDGVFYDFTGAGIPGWDNSLLVVTLKNGTYTDQEMYRFRLNGDGITLAPSTSLSPNPERYFGADQALNGRLRDIAISPNGGKIYLINNGGADRDKITVYSYNSVGIKENTYAPENINLFPNPAGNLLSIRTSFTANRVEVYNVVGERILVKESPGENLDISKCAPGFLILKVYPETGKPIVKTFVKE
ncbi:MAG: PQQ-dependent sugar dehydrogenase, partial [Bacteroidia bacterium]